MPTISRDSIQLRFTAKDNTTSAIRSLRGGLSDAGAAAKRLRDNITSIGSSRVIRSLRSVTGSLSSIAGFSGAIGAGGVVASFAALAVTGQRAGDSLGKTAAKFGETTEELGKLRFAISQTTDITQKNFDVSLQRMTRRLAEAAQGAGEAQGAIRELGLDAQALADAGPAEAYRQIAEAMSQVSDQSDRVRLAFKLFDSGGVGLVNSFTGGRAAIEALGDEAERLGVVFDRLPINRIQAANDRLSRLKDIFVAIGISVANQLVEPIFKVTQFVEDFVKANGGAAQLTDKIFSITVQKTRELYQWLVNLLEPVRALITAAAQATGLTARSNEDIISNQTRLINDYAEAIKDLENNRPTSIAGRLLDNLPLLASTEDRVKRFRELTEESERIRDRAIKAVVSNDAGANTPIFELPKFRSDAEIRSEVESLLGEASKTVKAYTPPTVPVVTTPDNTAELKAAAKRQIDTLRASFDQRLAARQRFNQQVAELQSNAQLAGLDNSDTAELKTLLQTQLNAQLDSIAKAETAAKESARRIRENAQKEQARLNTDATSFTGLASFDTSGVANLSQGLDEIRQRFRQELKEINLAVNLPDSEKARAIREAFELKTRLEEELSATVRIQTALSSAGSITDSLGQFAQSSQDNAVARLQETADRQAEIRQDLLQAFQSGDQQEVASAQRKLKAIQALSKAEQQDAVKRFKRNQRIQKLNAIINTAAAATGVLADTKGDAFARIAGLTAVVAAGAAQIKAINDTKLQQPSVSGASGGITDRQLSNAQGNFNTANQGDINISLPEDQNLFSRENVVELFDKLNEAQQSGNLPRFNIA